MTLDCLKLSGGLGDRRGEEISGSRESCAGSSSEESDAPTRAAASSAISLPATAPSAGAAPPPVFPRDPLAADRDFAS